MRDTIDMAREAGFPITVSTDPNSPPSWWGAGHDDRFKAFEALVRANERDVFAKIQFESILQAIKIEREACEALYEHEDVQAPVGNSAWGEAYQDGWIAGAQVYRDAIRNRGNT
jgi:hypothetical protein